ncbi:OmpA family protein [Nordella sp. HKS 07]|uniref:OmpA family protein n=1 Tax=Nordella sp. HKS 07 TaxID=2712222 RepID=UPI0013E1F479|nr:OmpA family protein [Nordella sp. HKS 07]QIG46604.1 OmpA family protein [Nordella sp. HKS 07]
MRLIHHARHALLGVIALICAYGTATAQEGLGAFMPHEGATVTTAWANAYGPDAESWMRFANVGPQSFDINYSSSRGTVAVRRIFVSDRMNGRTLVLGYSAKMPLVMSGTTTLGTSAAVLEEQRSSGQASSNLMYNAAMATMPGTFTLVEKSKMSVNLDGNPVDVPVIHANGRFQDGRQSAVGDFYFLDNKNNPMLLQYSVQFKGEKTPRSERYVLVTPSADERAKMEQALAARKAYTTYGIHFDFDKASVQNSSLPLLKQIAIALRNNPLWTLSITGHTDSIGDKSYNLKLSKARAESVKARLVKLGVDPGRLSTAGAGAGQPVATNNTLQGRALNRRVVLERTDR